MKDELIQVRALIAKGWTKCAGARNAFGEPVSPHNPHATCFCIFGALVKVYETPDTPWSPQVSQTLWFIDSVNEGSSIALNDRDGTTQADVLALLDRAIAQAE